MVSDRVTTLVVVFEEDVLTLICGYAPQGGRSFVEKQSFYDELKHECDMHSADDLVMCLGDISGHVGRHIDGFDEVHVGYGVGQRNSEECHKSFVWRRKYVCQIHGSRERKDGG